jgi:hypothetical protein
VGVGVDADGVGAVDVVVDVLVEPVVGVVVGVGGPTVVGDAVEPGVVVAMGPEMRGATVVDTEGAPPAPDAPVVGVVAPPARAPAVLVTRRDLRGGGVVAIDVDVDAEVDVDVDGIVTGVMACPVATSRSSPLLLLSEVKGHANSTASTTVAPARAMARRSVRASPTVVVATGTRGAGAVPGSARAAASSAPAMAPVGPTTTSAVAPVSTSGSSLGHTTAKLLSHVMSSSLGSLSVGSAPDFQAPFRTMARSAPAAPVQSGMRPAYMKNEKPSNVIAATAPARPVAASAWPRSRTVGSVLACRAPRPRNAAADR